MIRFLHRTIGILFVPFFFITALTGIVLLFRKSGWYGQTVKKTALGLHNWEIAREHIGIILSAALLTMGTTGVMLFREKPGQGS